MKIRIPEESGAENSLSITEVLNRVQSGELEPETLVFVEGTFGWIPVARLLETKSAKDQLILESARPLSEQTVKEFRRTCRECGKIWHSLVAREDQIAKNIRFNSFQMCFQGLTCSPAGNAGAAQSNMNIESNQTEIMRLRSCPGCQSGNFEEEIISLPIDERFR